MMDPNADPYAVPAEGDAAEAPSKFGAEDVFDLNQVSVIKCVFLYRMWSLVHQFALQILQEKNCLRELF